ncbi:MAG: fibronectin type III-like domain-contianing protein, partial [Anaerolineae bacterium]|nr:fibronectin type III-like domain-contianing protein [Anaerolineae bacterium]
RGPYKTIETVQLYVRDMVGQVTRPVKELKDFQRVSLEAGETRQVVFQLAAVNLSFLDVNLKPIIEAGEFTLWVGPDSASGLSAPFEIV